MKSSMARGKVLAPASVLVSMVRFRHGKTIYELELRGNQLLRRTGPRPVDEDIEVYRTEDEAALALEFARKEWMKLGFEPIESPRPPQILLAGVVAPRVGPVGLLDAHGRAPKLTRPKPVRRIRGRDRLGPREQLEQFESVADPEWEGDSLVAVTVRVPESEPSLEEILENPLASQLRRLRIRADGAVDGSELLGRLTRVRTMRELSLVHYEVVEDFRGSTLDVSRHGELLVPLERLTLSADRVIMGAPIPFVRLGSLSLEVGTLDRETVMALTRSALGDLESLTLWFGAREDGSTVTVDDAFELIRACPRLAKLTLATCEIVDALVARIAASDVASRLESLDLSSSLLTDEGFEVLLDRARFTKLSALDLEQTRLTRGAWMRAKEALPFATLDLHHSRIESVRGFVPAGE